MEKFGYTSNLTEDKDVVPVVNIIDGYEGIEKKIPEDALEEETEEEISVRGEDDPLGAGSRQAELDKLDEDTLRRTIAEIIDELS